MTDRTLLDRLCALKAQGVDFDTAWAFATGGNRRNHFQPTDRDDGTQHPDKRPIDLEPHRRFIYRTYRAAYLGTSTPALSVVRDLSDREAALPMRMYSAKGALAA